MNWNASIKSRPEPADSGVQSLTLRDLEAEAAPYLGPMLADYFSGGAGDEESTRANESAYQRLGLLPRILRGAGVPDLSLELFGQRLAMPVLVAPTAFHRLAHPDGELATARAARDADTVMIAAMAATESIESIAREGGKLWFQLYLQPDRGFMQSLVRRAERSGCTALVITVDSPVFGKRERDARNGFTDLPPGMRCENLREPGEGEPESRVRGIAFSTALSWQDLDWLRSITTLKILLKGVAHPEDARLALQHGVDGVIVSNHGGRQLDTIPATLDLLPAIVEAVAGRIPVLLDGGVRRGTDVIKALALGATAVAIGRPLLWGLAIDGERGAGQVLQMLKIELERALALCGCARPDQLGPTFIHRHG